MYRLLGFLVFFFCSFSAWSQTYKQWLRMAEESFQAEDYNTALQGYEEALALDDSNGELWYKKARCLHELAWHKPAKKAYQKALKSRPSPDEAAYYYALLLVRDGAYEKAIEQFQAFTSKAAPAHPLLPFAEQRMASCYWALDHLQADTLYNITWLGEDINSPYADFSPTYLNNDKWFFTSYQKQSGQEDYISLIYLVDEQGDGKARAIQEDSAAWHAGTMLSSPFLYRKKNISFRTACQPSNKGILCDIVMWVNGEYRHLGLRQDSCTATHPSVARGTKGQMVLYYASDCQTGHLDIYAAEIDVEGQLKTTYDIDKTINTPGKEVSPLMVNDTLYFASDYHYGYGGLDIFYYHPSCGVQNAGPQINSPADDFFYRPSEGQKGWFSSNRDGALTLNGRTCCYDLFAWEKQTPQTPRTDSLPLIVEEGNPKKTSTPLDSISRTLNEKLPASVFFHNDEPNPHSLDTTTNHGYGYWYNAYMQVKEDYIDSFSAQPAMLAALDTFFTDSVQAGRVRLYTLANACLTLLEQGYPIEISLRAYCSPLATNPYNINLAKRRNHSVLLFFESFKKNAMQAYLDSGQLRFTFLPYGEERAPEGISDNRLEQKKSVFDVRAALERKTVVKAITVGPKPD